MVSKAQKKILKKADEIKKEMRELERNERNFLRRAQKEEEKKKKLEKQSVEDETNEIVEKVNKKKLECFGVEFLSLKEQLEHEKNLQLEITTKINELKNQLDISISKTEKCIESFRSKCIHPTKFIEKIKVKYSEDGGGGQCSYQRFSDCNFCLLCCEFQCFGYPHFYKHRDDIASYRQRCINSFRKQTEYNFDEILNPNNNNNIILRNKKIVGEKNIDKCDISEFKTWLSFAITKFKDEMTLRESSYLSC